MTQDDRHDRRQSRWLDTLESMPTAEAIMHTQLQCVQEWLFCVQYGLHIPLPICYTLPLPLPLPLTCTPLCVTFTCFASTRQGRYRGTDDIATLANMAAGFSRAALNSISSSFSRALLITMMAACTGGGRGEGRGGEGREKGGRGGRGEGGGGRGEGRERGGEGRGGRKEGWEGEGLGGERR